MSQTVSGLDLQSLALGLDLKLKICECDMSLQTVESDGSKRKKGREERDDLRSENCSIDMIRVE